MKTNAKRLSLVVKFLDVAIVLVAISLVYWIVYNLPYVGKFSEFRERLPASNKFDDVRQRISFIVYFLIFIITVVHAIIAVLLFAVRRFLKSLINNGIFRLTHANKIRKIAIFFLCLAGLALFFNFIYLLAAFNKGNMPAFNAGVLSLMKIFENYVVTALIAFSIAEIFIAGIKLQEENDLTV